MKRLLLASLLLASSANSSIPTVDYRPRVTFPPSVELKVPEPCSVDSYLLDLGSEYLHQLLPVTTLISSEGFTYFVTSDLALSPKGQLTLIMGGSELSVGEIYPIGELAMLKLPGEFPNPIYKAKNRSEVQPWTCATVYRGDDIVNARSSITMVEKENSSTGRIFYGNSRFGESGDPVFDEDNLVGIIVGRNVDTGVVKVQALDNLFFTFVHDFISRNNMPLETTNHSRD